MPCQAARVPMDESLRRGLGPGVQNFVALRRLDLLAEPVVIKTELCREMGDGV